MANALLKGKSPQFQSVVRAAGVVAVTDVTILLLGESGTGKELFARFIHGESRRATHPFVAINCAAIPETLAEAELFGHAKGAFTGAVSQRPGLFQSAHGGTLFLDEIGEMALAVQAKLLRFLETGECQPLGGKESRPVNVRVIAATNRDLRDQLQAGTFRKDLYYRLQVVPMELPPLRQRCGDAHLLTQEFLQEFSISHGLPAPRFAPAAWRLLGEYDWPGNVRELRNFCERLVVLRAGQEIQPGDLLREFDLSRSSEEKGNPLFTLPEQGISLEALEKSLIAQALVKSRGNRSHAARLLDLTRDAFLYRMKKYSI